MNRVTIRAADGRDLGDLTKIYSHYVVHTTITFDLAPLTLTI